MTKIMTVTGPISPKELGFCQPHEHLMISQGVSATVNPALCIDDIGRSAAEAAQFRAMGGNTIIDAQPGGCNRVAEALVQISCDTGVNIVASTGVHKHIFYPKDHWIFTQEQDVLRDVFIHELTVGMYTNIDVTLSREYIPSCAGIIKIAYDLEGLTPVYDKCFKAAAEAARECDVPMMIHIEQGSGAGRLLDTLISWGVNPRKVMFCHMDREIMPLSFYVPFLEKGIALEFDTIGRFKYHSDEDEAVLIKGLIDMGYEDQILCSLDTTRERLKAYNPSGVGLCHLFTSFFPLLKAYGVADRQIRKISHDNIVRVFTSMAL